MVHVTTSGRTHGTWAEAAPVSPLAEQVREAPLPEAEEMRGLGDLWAQDLCQEAACAQTILAEALAGEVQAHTDQAAAVAAGCRG